MSIALMWFRRDLRCQDNPALSAACENHEAIIPLYIASEIGGAQGWWLHNSLLALQKQLKMHGLSLCLKRGEPLQIIEELIAQYSVEAIYWNRCYEPKLISRDKHIKAQLQSQGIRVKSFNGSLLTEPWTVKNKEDGYFKIFTSYWKQIIKQLTIPQASLIQIWPTSPPLVSEELNDWQLLPNNPNWAKQFANYWEPGEVGAIKKLNFFIENHLQNYKNARNMPYESGTSRLSPHLHFGEISPRQILRIIEGLKMNLGYDLASIEQFAGELGWREFSYYLLYHYPALPHENCRREFDLFPWQKDKQYLRCWQQGKTGFPIIDAGMRELWHTGYMHNRVRMIAASFLVKDLLIDWREGAKWFLYTLLDADLANNAASWQWVAGSGVDSAPYFRIFNPILQGEKFDPQGEYVKTWLPELADVPAQWIHKPWQALGHRINGYPPPIVDHAEKRKIALETYKIIKGKK